MFFGVIDIINPDFQSEHKTKGPDDVSGLVKGISGTVSFSKTDGVHTEEYLRCGSIQFQSENPDGNRHGM